MTISDLSLDSFTQFARVTGTHDGARHLCQAGTFRFRSQCYRFHYRADGPVVVRDGPAVAMKDFFAHRLLNGTVFSRSSRLTGQLRSSREAVLQCMVKVLDDWMATQPDERCIEATRRILSCHERHDTVLDLRHLGMTTVPLVLGWLGQLTALRLSGNALTAVPPEVKRLTGLRVLELADNRIGELPPWIGELESLRVLSLSGNRLTAWPHCIDKLPQLAFVWLEDNRITELWPGAPFYPAKFEVFLRGNPLSDNAAFDAALGMEVCRRSPLHHEALDAGLPGTSDYLRPAGRSQLGRLAVLIHGARGNAGPALPDAADTRQLGPELREDFERLFADMQASLAKLERTRTLPIVVPRRPHITAYRLDLVRRLLVTDADLYRLHAPELRAAARFSGELLLEKLDELELALAQLLVERSQVPVRVCATLGRSVLRMALLNETVRQVWSTEEPSPALELRVQYDMALALDLPIELRPYFYRGWYGDEHYGPVRAQCVQDGVLARESAQDFRRLDDFMADWKPWQALVRRVRGAAMVRADRAMRERLAQAEGMGAESAHGEGAAQAQRAAIMAEAERGFRDFCRDGFRAYRRGGEQGFAAWCREGEPNGAPETATVAGA